MLKQSQIWPRLFLPLIAAKRHCSIGSVPSNYVPVILKQWNILSVSSAATIGARKLSVSSNMSNPHSVSQRTGTTSRRTNTQVEPRATMKAGPPRHLTSGRPIERRSIMKTIQISILTSSTAPAIRILRASDQVAMRFQDPTTVECWL